MRHVDGAAYQSAAASLTHVNDPKKNRDSSNLSLFTGSRNYLHLPGLHKTRRSRCAQLIRTRVGLCGSMEPPRKSAKAAGGFSGTVSEVPAFF